MSKKVKGFDVLMLNILLRNNFPKQHNTIGASKTAITNFKKKYKLAKYANFDTEKLKNGKFETKSWLLVSKV